jgi:hypothetical protein
MDTRDHGSAPVLVRDRRSGYAPLIEWVEDLALKQCSFQERPFLAALGLTAESPELVLFRIPKGEEYTWTQETNLAQKEKIRFGN